MNHVATTSMNRRDRPAFIYRHVVGFEETNVVGNVYFTSHVSWQGRCREMFLREYAPSVLDDLKTDLRLVTLKCSCEYFAELQPFDEIEVRMRLRRLFQNRISLEFEYWCVTPRSPALVAAGAQDLACMRLKNGRLGPVPPPPALAAALEPFASGA